MDIKSLSTITTAFGLLDEATQKALREWKGEIEYYGTGGFCKTTQRPVWTPYYVYRAKPIPLTKPSINWDHVAPEWKWLAMDKNGRTYLYTREPLLSGDEWRVTRLTSYADIFSSFVPGTCDWKDSLVERPPKENNTTEDLL